MWTNQNLICPQHILLLQRTHNNNHFISDWNGKSPGTQRVLVFSLLLFSERGTVYRSDTDPSLPSSSLMLISGITNAVEDISFLYYCHSNHKNSPRSHNKDKMYEEHVLQCTFLSLSRALNASTASSCVAYTGAGLSSCSTYFFLPLELCPFV